MSVGLAGGDDAPRQVQQEQGQRFDFNAEGTDGRGGRVRKPNAIPLKERRAKHKDCPETRRLQDDIARQLKAGSASGTLEAFNEAMAAGVALRSNLLSGVLNQCAKSGWMDDCMRVLREMKARGVVIEENTFVPLIRGFVSRGNCGGALELLRDMVNQGVQPRLRCYEPVIAGMCAEGDMDGARAAWEHMEQQGVIPREQQYVDFLSGLGVAGELWEHARSSKLDELLSGMSYHARNLTMEQMVELETRFNAVPVFPPTLSNGDVGQDVDFAVPCGGERAVGDRDRDAKAAAAAAAGGRERVGNHDPAGAREDEAVIVSVTAAELPLARRVKVESAQPLDSDDDNSRLRGWSDALEQEPVCCPACGGQLKAVGLTCEERARIRKTLFGLAGLQVKKHSRSRWTRMVQKNKKLDSTDYSYFSFTDQDQREQLQIFVDWLHSQREAGKTYTAVIDSANVAYHKGNPWHFSLPQVDLVVQALEARGERPLVVIAEKYIDRVGDIDDLGPVPEGKFKYMASSLNKAIVKRWRAKSQMYECSDEASDDWYWLYAAVAFDDIPMTVISNDRTRDHRMSLAEPVPFLRWRTTQLAKFDLSWGLKHLISKRNEGVNAQGWPNRPPTVSIQAPPAFTRDIQKSDQGCWHLPAGAGDDWLCVDIPRGLRLGLDKLPAPKKRRSTRIDVEDTVAVGAGARALASEESAVGLHGTEGESKAGVDEEGGRNWEGTGDSDEDKDTIREVGGILQTMRVKKGLSRGFRHVTQGTVEAAAEAAKAKAATAAKEAAVAIAEAAVADPKTPSNEVAEGSSRAVGPSCADDTSAFVTRAVESLGSVGGVGRELQIEVPAIRSSAASGVAATVVSVEGSALVTGEGGQSPDWASMTVNGLKEELRKRGLKVSGRKAELVERLLRA